MYEANTQAKLEVKTSNEVPMAEAKQQRKVTKAAFEKELFAMASTCFEGRVGLYPQGIYVRLLNGERFLITVRNVVSD